MAESRPWLVSPSHWRISYGLFYLTLCERPDGSSLPFPFSVVYVLCWSGGGPGFCRFPGLDPSEAQRRQAWSRLPAFRAIFGAGARCMDLLARGETPKHSSSRASKKVIYAAIVANLAIAICKYVAAAFTKSSAMLAEAVHSTVDTGNELLLLLGMKRSVRPPDALHHYGSWKATLFLFAPGSGLHLRRRRSAGCVPWDFAPSTPGTIR